MDMFAMSIETGNAAFADGNGPYEVCRILREAADQLENGATSGSVRDFNGNTVAQFSLVVTAEDS
jgi:hypothetical protein